MGFLNILGSFAEGYISERGVEGTIQDVSKLASKASKFFDGGDDEFDENEYAEIWNGMLDQFYDYVNNIDLYNAMATMDSFYKEMEEDKDFWYYYHAANACALILELLNHDDYRIQQPKRKYKDFISKARQNASGTEQFEKIHEVEERFSNALEFLEAMKKWSTFTDRFYELLSSMAYSEAIQLCEKYYRENETSKDYFYYDYKTKGYAAWYSSLKANDARSPEIKKELDSNFNCAKSYAGDQDVSSLIETYNNAVCAHNANIPPAPKTINENNKNNHVETPKPQLASSKSVRDAEMEYLEEYKTCLADYGEISNKERRLLFRLAKSLGISEARALELEKSLMGTSLTPEEKEYADEYKACLEDGEISDRERRLLDKIRISLNISVPRATEIENALK